MTRKEADEKELLEILELAREAEKQAREMCESITTHTEKWRRRVEAKPAISTKKSTDSKA